MMTNETLTLGVVLVSAWVAGGVLGVVFFGGLWWTVRKSLSAAKPALWVLGSLLLRMGATMAGFYVVSGGDWQRLLSCLVGFVMARQLVTRLTRLPEEKSAQPPQEIRHAP